MRDSLFSLWIAATTTGFAAGGAVWSLLALITGYLTTTNDALDWAVCLASVAAAGLVMGVSQGLYLQRLTGKISYRGWACATIAGGLAGLTLVGAVGSQVAGLRPTLSFSIAGAYLSRPLYETGYTYDSYMMLLPVFFFVLYWGCIYAFVFAAMGGIMPGVLQWFLLRHHFRNAFFWVVFSSLAFALSGVASVLITWLAGSFAGGAAVVLDNPVAAALIGLLGWCVLGFTIGVVTAPVLTWFQSQPLEEGTLF
ncbi:MAG TPA: hypothetical protein VF914_22885 [Chloroflexia bacterium]